MTSAFSYKNKYAAAAAMTLFFLGNIILLIPENVIGGYKPLFLIFIFLAFIVCCIFTELTGIVNMKKNRLILHYAYSKRAIHLSDIKECVCSSDYRHTRFGSYYRIIMTVTTVDGKHCKIWDRLTVKANDLITSPNALESEIAEHPFSAMCRYIDRYIRREYGKNDF